MTDFDMPEAEDVFQEDVDPASPVAGPIPVVVEGIVRTEEPGSRTTGFRKFNLSTTDAQRILDDDPRRKCATIIPIDTDIRLGYSQSDAVGSGGTRLPMAVPLLLTTSDEVWACAVNVACEVSVFFELWAR